MSLNLENLPASPATRGRAPKLMTPRRRGVWVAVAVLMLAGAAASVFLWRYQPLEPGPWGGDVRAASEVWSSRAAQAVLVEFEHGAAMSYGFSLRNNGLLPVTVTELHPGEDGRTCGFFPTSGRGVSGTGSDVYDAATTLQPLPLTVAPGAQARIEVAGRLGDPAFGPCQVDGVRMVLDSIPATVRVGWMSHHAELPIADTIGWGRGVEEYLSPTPGN